MKAKIYIGAKKYALYIGRKIVEKTLEFLTLPAKFVSNKVQDLKNLTMWGQSVQTSARTRNLFDKNSTPLDAYVTNQGMFAHATSKTWVIEVEPNTTYTLSYDNSMINTNPRCYIVGFENKPAIGSTDATSYYMNTSATKHTITFTTDNNINYITLWLVHALGVEGIQEALSTAQLEEGSTATPYVPYIATTPTPDTPIPVESVGDRTKNLFNLDDLINAYPTYFEVDKKIGGIKIKKWATVLYSEGIPVNWKAGSTLSFTPISTGDNMSINARITMTTASGTKSSTYITDGNGDIHTIRKVKLANDIIKITFDRTSDNPDFWGLENFMVSEEDIPFEPYGYKVPVTIEAKNYWKNFAPTTINGVTIGVKNNGIVYASGTCTTSNNFTVSGITLESGTYTLISYANKNSISTDSQIFIQIYSPSTQTNYSIKNNNLNNKITIELPYAEDYQFRFRIQEGVNYDGLTFRPVLQKGEYIEPTTTNIYLNEPLHKVGDYTDTLSIEGNNVTVVRNAKTVNVSDLNIVKGLFSSQHYRFNSSPIDDLLTPTTISERRLLFCDKYPVNNVPLGYLDNVPYGISAYQDNKLYFYNTDLDNTNSKILDFVNIGGSITYILATPTTETYTIDTPIQLEQGDLTLNIDTIVKPSKIEITGDIDNDD